MYPAIVGVAMLGILSTAVVIIIIGIWFIREYNRKIELEERYREAAKVALDEAVAQANRQLKRQHKHKKEAGKSELLNLFEVRESESGFCVYRSYGADEHCLVWFSFDVFNNQVTLAIGTEKYAGTMVHFEDLRKRACLRIQAMSQGRAIFNLVA